jgi:hypothetical protein
MRARHHPLRYMQELTLPAAERRAAQAERRAEAAIRRERENEHGAWRRAAALEAERHRQQHGHGP